MLLPLSVASVSWTVAVAGTGVTPVGGGSAASRVELSMPDGAIESPASISAGTDDAVRPVRMVPAATLYALRIPAAALSAYQRASTIIGGADDGCGLEWPLLAAIGKVESGHGSVNGSQLREDGVAVPRIIGIPLDGSRATARISDTDGGRLDGDDSWDRAVGPMQFIPSTWSVVGVDADDDSQRNPQDIDDAALAAAVYLCSGDEDLSTSAGQRAAVLRYNHSQAYVDMVLAAARSYAAGGIVPAAAGVMVSAARPAVRAAPARKARSRQSGELSGLKAASPEPEPMQPASPRGGSATGEEPEGPGPAPASPVKPLATALTTTGGILTCAFDSLGQLLTTGSSGGCVADGTP